MKIVLQRVKNAKVEVEGKVLSAIDHGFLLLLGIHQQDTKSLIPYLVDKIIQLRVFGDEEDKMNRCLIDVKGSILVVSQFTLYANCSSGRRPSFIESAKPELAIPLYEAFINSLKEALKETSCSVNTGQFGAKMEISLINDGPVTLILEKVSDSLK